jgi:hypothetical protein
VLCIKCSVNRQESGEAKSEENNNKNTSTPPYDSESKKDEIQYATYEERVAAFKALLDNMGVTSTWTWDMTMRTIIKDERYKALKTLAEKKQVLAEFQAEKRKIERVNTSSLFILLYIHSSLLHLYNCSS